MGLSMSTSKHLSAMKKAKNRNQIHPPRSWPEEIHINKPITVLDNEEEKERI